MIECICGRAGSGKSTCIAEKLRAALQSSADTHPIYLIVPEQQVLVWESRAARLLPPSAPLRLEIVSFTRLENLVSRTCGGMSQRPITRGGKAAILWSVLTSLAPQLRVYGGVKRMERVVPQLLSAISEMKQCAITPADLDAAADALETDPESVRLAERTRDLALLYAAYTALLGERYDDDEDALAHLAQRLRETDYFRGADVYIDSFFSLTAAENEILYHIFRQAESVTVSVSCPPRATGEAQFDSPAHFLATMQKLAERAKKELRITALTENRRAKTAQLAYLEENIWRFGAAAREAGSDVLPEVADSVRIFRVHDAYAEAKAAAVRIRSLVRAGARYRDIALIARDVAALGGILDTALTRHGIPYFVAERTDVPSRPAAQLLFAALRTVGGGWRREDVMSAVKTGLCSLTDDESDALEAYTRTWHIRGAHAFSEPWTMNPDGYEKTVSKRGRRTLSLANAAREKLVLPLAAFDSLFRGEAPTVPDICRGLYELLCEFGVWDALAAEAETLSRIGRAREASEASQLWDILMDALDTLADALPEAHADAAAFSALLRQTLAAVRIGAIPGTVDEVVIGQADQVRLDEVEHVMLLGVNEGRFPASPEEDGFFSDADKIRLEGEGILLSATRADRMKEELLWFYRAVSLSHRTLSVFCPETDGKDSLVPSLGVERILTLLPEVKMENADAWTAEDWLFAPIDARMRAHTLRGTALEAALLQLGALPPAILSPIPLSARGEQIPEETVRLLFPHDVSMTQSRLDAFVQCRFGYYCRYVTRLEEERDASLTMLNVGTFVHRVFELFFDRTAEMQLPLSADALSAVTDSIVADTVKEICPDHTLSRRAVYLITRLRRAVTPMLRSFSEEFAASEFTPTCFELPIGQGEGAIPPYRIPIADGGRFVSLRGTVDRLDIWRDGDTSYVRVVDYKTGQRHFDARDISLGIHMQLLVYLFSVLRMPQGETRRALSGGGKLSPAGALYFSAQPGETLSDTPLSAEEAEEAALQSIQRSGFLVDDERVLRAMEPTLSRRFIPVKMTASGKLSGAVVSAEEIRDFEKTMQESIAREGGTMLAGHAEAEPKSYHGKDPCAYCAMYPICRAKEKGGRK